MRRLWLIAYSCKFASNKLQANIKKLSYELVINIHTPHLQYVFYLFIANYEKIQIVSANAQLHLMLTSAYC